MTLPNSYHQLPAQYFYTLCNPSKFPALTVAVCRADLLESFKLPPDQLTSMIEQPQVRGLKPLAMAYAGQQFGHYVPLLGDGRAHLLAEVSDGEVFMDAHLKGSGRTPYSRGGDGKATLGSVIREYLMSEYLHQIGVPSSRSAAIFLTGEKIYRDVPQPGEVPGAILLRLATSHVRVGTFQLPLPPEQRRDLLHWVIKRHHPKAEPSIELHDDDLCQWWLQVAMKQIALVSQWMAAGFIHGVMNTDNCFISGETLDFGPCAFLEHYHPNQVFSSIDRQGRYRFSQQLPMVLWNLARLAETLLPLFKRSGSWPQWFQEQLIQLNKMSSKKYQALTALKLGIDPTLHSEQEIEQLCVQWFDYLQHTEPKIDYHTSYSHLFTHTSNLAHTFKNTWQQMNPAESLSKQHHPTFYLRNHLIDECIAKANGGEWGLFETLNRACEHPWLSKEVYPLELLQPGGEGQLNRATFCGT